MEVGEDVLDPRRVVRPPLDPVSTCPQQYRPCRAGTSSGKLQKTSKKPLTGCQVKPPDSCTPMKLTVLGPHELSHGHTDDQLECRLPWQSPRSIDLCGSSWYLWCCGPVNEHSLPAPPGFFPSPECRASAAARDVTYAPVPAHSSEQSQVLWSNQAPASVADSSPGSQVVIPSGGRVCLSTRPTPDFWWLIGRTLASPSWSVEPPYGGWEWTGRSQVADLLSSWVPETTDCRNPGTSRWWHARWPPLSARHRRPVEGLVGCTWSGNWCFDGWAEVVAGMQCPHRPRRCRWPGSCPADSASVGQSLPGEPPPGTRQHFLAEEEEENLPHFLLPWKGRRRALPAPAGKGGSCVTVLCVADGGEPSLSNTEGLGAVFLDDVFVLVLTSFCLAKVTDEPVIRSACLMARTRAWSTFGSGPTTWWPSNGAVRTAEITGGWKLKSLRRASRRNNCRLDAAAKPAETWASWMMVNFSRRSLERSSLGESSSISSPPEMRRWRTSWPSPRCPNIHDETSGMKMGSCCQWSHGHPAV